MHKVVWIQGRGYWDQAIVEWLLPKNSVHLMDEFPTDSGAIVVIPARHCVNSVDKFNQAFQKLPWVLLMACGDEENIFPIEKVTHPRIKTWVQTPKPKRHFNYRPLINGWSPATSGFQPSLRSIDFSFSGQVTHEVRRRCLQFAKSIPKQGYLNPTAGFTQGLPSAEYFSVMGMSKIVLCPSGPATPDTFRTWEALQMGCIPIVDCGPVKGYWDFVAPGHPFPVLNNWSELEPVLAVLLENWETKAAECQTWWADYKKDLTETFNKDLYELSR